MIKFFVVGVFVVVLGLLVFLNATFTSVPGRLQFTVFVAIWAAVKIWESFYTSKEKEVMKYHGDWTLLLTSLLYLATGVCVTFEFFCINRGIDWRLVTVGLPVTVGAVALRHWCIRTLGNQWAIHAIGPSQLAHPPALVTTGPYRYVRHPIYLSYILELVGVAAAFSAFYALIFAITVNTASYILRARYEERSATARLGEQYFEYKKKTAFMLPTVFNTRGQKTS